MLSKKTKRDVVKKAMKKDGKGGIIPTTPYTPPPVSGPLILPGQKVGSVPPPDSFKQPTQPQPKPIAYPMPMPPTPVPTPPPGWKTPGFKIPQQPISKPVPQPMPIRPQPVKQPPAPIMQQPRQTQPDMAKKIMDIKKKVVSRYKGKNKKVGELKTPGDAIFNLKKPINQQPA